MRNEKNANREKYEMKCEVIRDLLPSYLEGLTSSVSNELIENHLNDCGDCRRYASEMGAAVDAPDPQAADRRDHDIKPFLKLRKKIWRNILLTVLACALVFGGSMLYFVHSWTPDFNDVTITCEKNGDVAELTFSAKNKNTILASYAGVYSGNAGADAADDLCLELAASRKNPFTTPIRKNAYYSYTFIDEDTVYDNNTSKPMDITDESYFLVMFGDKTVKINIKDLSKEKVTIMK